MDLLQLFILLIIVGFVLFFGVTIFWRKKKKSRPAEATKLMLVAVRRRQSGIAHVMELPAEAQTQLLKSLENQWRIVNSRWLGYCRAIEGFISDASGLAAPGSEDWRILYLYEINDYDHFRDCVKIFESEEYALLRQHLEVRMICGESIQDMTGKLQRVY